MAAALTTGLRLVNEVTELQSRYENALSWLEGDGGDKSGELEGAFQFELELVVALWDLKVQPALKRAAPNELTHGLYHTAVTTVSKAHKQLARLHGASGNSSQAVSEYEQACALLGDLDHQVTDATESEGCFVELAGVYGSAGWRDELHVVMAEVAARMPKTRTARAINSSQAAAPFAAPLAAAQALGGFNLTATGSPNAATAAAAAAA
eukprot:CAMPEP_0172626348 /NCGR_PEP_ID=MMETSP1068-20121228/149802_1 /TAXON_ID=35684 /ORGANISM="Pseudopedinella elastica, Strain CCMP716" /LENGTH=208 /DNA_ID=CAMNT_0013435943 /DNA_START=179 /DNA_END=801 /DNA_ORIENTATION=-